MIDRFFFFAELSEELALQKAMKSHQKGDKEKSSAEKNFEDDSSDDVVTFKVKYLGKITT